jgi:DnaJ-class molecular chaperone
MMELFMEPVYASFEKLIEYYVEMWYVFATTLLRDPALLQRQDAPKMPRTVPLRLQAQYRLLHLQAEASLDEARTRYRELAKHYHPDAGGNHADFLALRQAYEQVAEYLRTQRCN